MRNVRNREEEPVGNSERIHQPEWIDESKPPGDPKLSDQAGMVTAELALGFIPLMIVVVLVIASIAVTATYIDVHGASAVVARAASLGKEGHDLEELARSLMPGCHLGVQHSGDLVEVTVQYEPTGILAPFGEISVSTTAMVEPEVSSSSAN